MFRYTSASFTPLSSAAIRRAGCSTTAFLRANAFMAAAAAPTSGSAAMITARRFNTASFTTDADRANLRDRAEANARHEERTRATSSSSTADAAGGAAAEGGESFNAEGGRMEKDAEGNLHYYNPWEVLGLKPGASAHDIRLRYHELLQECHPEYVKGDKKADVVRLNQVNKAYEIITKSPTLDKRYRNLVSDTQRLYYKILPEWMAKNIDEQPRYISWVRWRVPSPLQVVFLLLGCYGVGRFYSAFPVFTIVFVFSILFDCLFHTMSAPFALSMLFLSAVVSNQTYTMAWLVSPRSMLQGELGY